MIYLDNNATTPLDPKVIEAMEGELRAPVGNPSSVHRFGQQAKARLLAARRTLAEVLGCKVQEILFTSSGTEALNLAIFSLFKERKGHLITSNVEHAAVHAAVEALEGDGVVVTRLSAGLYGAVTPEAVLEAIRSDTKAIVLMAVNNETGVKTDWEGIAAIAEERRIPFVVDGVSLMGKELFSIPKGVSAFCFSAHKFHGPSGVGGAFVRSSLKLKPLIYGGHQEYGRRGGTENLIGIVGMAEAARLLLKELPEATARMERLRDAFEAKMLELVPGVRVNGTGPRIPNTSNLLFSGRDGESLLQRLDLKGVAASHGSACSAGGLEPSRILLQMGLSRQEAMASLRFSFSRMTTEEEMEQAAEWVVTSLS